MRILMSVVIGVLLYDNHRIGKRSEEQLEKIQFLEKKIDSMNEGVQYYFQVAQAAASKLTPEQIEQLNFDQEFLYMLIKEGSAEME